MVGDKNARLNMAANCIIRLKSIKIFGSHCSCSAIQSDHIGQLQVYINVRLKNEMLDFLTIAKKPKIANANIHVTRRICLTPLLLLHCKIMVRLKPNTVE